MRGQAATGTQLLHYHPPRCKGDECRKSIVVGKDGCLKSSKSRVVEVNGRELRFEKRGLGSVSLLVEGRESRGTWAFFLSWRGAKEIQ